jgi:hypothetical protein
LRWLTAVVAFAFILLVARTTRAETWQAPVGGKAIALGDLRVACGPPAADWTLDADGHALRPPAADEAIGRATTVKVAANAAACEKSTSSITLVTTGRWPTIDPSASTVAIDEARVELRGRGLKGVIVAWRAAAKSGDDRCVQPQVEANVERCAVGVGRGLAADPSSTALEWWPAGARTSDDVVTYDAAARVVARGELALRPGRVLVSSVASSDASIDLAGAGVTRIPLVHPDAVSGADCGNAQCEISQGAIVVRGVSSLAGSVAIRIRLLPRVYLHRGDAIESTPTIQVPILPCTIAIASGDALRGVDDSRVVVRLDARCAADARRLRYIANGRSADVLQVEQDGSSALVLLRVGRVDGEELAILASRGTSDLAAVGAAHAPARALAAPRAQLSLAGYGPIDFIPTNRPATTRFADAPGAAKFVLVPVEGVYDATADASGATSVIAQSLAGGFVALRFAYRMPTLPGALASADLAVLVEPFARPIHEANVPAALGASTLGDRPLAELVCGDGGNGSVAVKPGTVAHVPYDARDTCRIILHRERLAAADGAQNLNLEIDITSAAGAARPEAHVSQPIVMRASAQPRFMWIRGVGAPFDRVTVRLSHSSDESHYVGGADTRVSTPSAQWSVVTGTGHARLYATTSIPTGLYRVSDQGHSGLLTLNFGVVARMTWLDTEGHEGFLGLEAGVMGMGLANDTDASGHSLTQVATVTGLGLSVPIANRSLATETSINLHAWLEYEVSRDLGHQPGSPLGFVFGPSISIGNIGTNL